MIGAAMGEAGVAGIGRLTMSRRERMVMLEPRGAGMVLVTLRAADEVRAPQFSEVDGAIDDEVGNLALLLAPVVVEVDAQGAPAATTIKDAVLNVFWDMCASVHGLSGKSWRGLHCSCGRVLRASRPARAV